MAVAVDVLTDIPYGAAGNFLLFLDLYQPDPLPDQPLPAVIYIHGGAWRRGDKALSKPPMLAETGRYIVASINYRLSDQAIFPAQLHDCKAAVRFLRANAARYGIDGGRIGAWGYSAGGHLAALLATTGGRPELEGASGSPGADSAIQAAVCVAAPSDLSRMGGWHNEPDSPEALLLGGPPGERVDLARQANPLSYIHPAVPPMLLIHGEDDDTVPVSQSQILYDALAQAGLPATFVRLPRSGHNFGLSSPHFPLVTERIGGFFDRWLHQK
jgi:acetyl esterase/lipase